MKTYYSEKYFEWQKKIGEFGGKVALFKFEPYVKENYTVLDFGCGGGYLLSNLNCKKKIGVEINDAARSVAEQKNIDVKKYSYEIEDNVCDLIISSHALEHTLNPFEELKQLYPKLKKNGLIVFIVPNEKKTKWKRNDINQHLYTWTEMNLGNLFTAAGYQVVAVEELYHRWPPKFHFIYNIFGDKIFHLICRIYGFIRRDLSQIRIVASKSE